MSNKTIELDYNESLDKKIISKIGNPFKCDTEALQSIMNKFYDTDKVIVGKKILVIRMLDIAEKYALNNSVIYITDNKEKYDEFLKSINEDKYGGDDEAFLFDDWKNLSEWMKVNNMPKFDIIIGNPPYEGKGHPLYLQILEICCKIANKIIWLCPSQWVKNYKDSAYLKKIKDHCPLISHNHISNPFDDACLANEVGIYEFGANNKYENYDEIKLERFSNPKLAKSIISKFENYTDNLWKHDKFNTKEKVYDKFCVNATWLRGHFLAGKLAWDWPTLFSEENRIRYDFKKMSCTHHWYFNTKNECKNFVSANETDICMFANYVAKINNSTTSLQLTLIPYLKDYTHAWTEQEIANELGLTQKEVDYIHEEMKPFGWKAQPKVQKKRKSKNDYFANMND